MSDGINKAILFGNLGADPELKMTDKGAVLKFRLATSHSWLDKEDKKQERTEWHNVVVFGKRADGLSKYLRKGSKLFVSGRIQTHSYDKDNQKHWFTEVIADEISFGGGAPSNGAYKSSPPPSQQAMQTPF